MMATKNELTTRDRNAITSPVESHDWWNQMKDQAVVMLKSGFLPATIKTAEQCMAIAMMGKELGIGFMESLRSINVIQGKPTVAPQIMLALAYRTGQVESKQVDSNNDRCIFTIKRKGEPAHSYEFGKKEATDMGLIGKDNYKKQAKVMFQWRAIAGNLRVSFPDAVSGLYTPEELGADVKIGEGDTMEIVAKAPPESRPITTPVDLAVHAEVAASSAMEIETNPSATKEATISEADWKAVEALRKTQQMTSDALAFHLKEMGFAKGSDLPQSRLFELRQWIKGA